MQVRLAPRLCSRLPKVAAMAFTGSTAIVAATAPGSPVTAPAIDRCCWALGPRPGAQSRSRRIDGSVDAIEDCIQQHRAAGGQILRLRVLNLVVADAADARDEDHRGRRDASHVDRVVAGAADDVLMRQ